MLFDFRTRLRRIFGHRQYFRACNQGITIAVGGKRIARPMAMARLSAQRKQIDHNLKWLKKDPDAYGGELLKTRRGRARPRPVATNKCSMHVVLRSSKARCGWSLKKHSVRINKILAKFARRHGVEIHDTATQHNHLHWHMTFSTRRGYVRFIRAVTAAVAMLVTGASRWHPSKRRDRFWDRRPFTRIVRTPAALLRLKDYIVLNKLEALGYGRIEARFLIAAWHDKKIHQSVGGG